MPVLSISRDAINVASVVIYTLWAPSEKLSGYGTVKMVGCSVVVMIPHNTLLVIDSFALKNYLPPYKGSWEDTAAADR